MRNWQKTPFIALVLLLAGVCLPAQNDFDSFGDGDFGDGIFGDGADFPELREEPRDYPLAGKEKEPEKPQKEDAPKTKEKKNFFKQNRTLELSILGIGLDLSNDFIAATDVINSPSYLLENINAMTENPGLIWKDPIVINLDNLFDGFNFNFGTFIKPISLNFNNKDKWGFGLDIAHIDMTGNLSISGNLITISEAEKDKFGVGAALFVDVGFPVFFHYNDIKIKLRPAVYLPLVYTEPNVTYSYTYVNDGIRYEINYDLQVYSVVNMEDTSTMAQSLMDNARDLPQHFGYDFGLNVEYPLLNNLDIGVDMVNIPFPFAGATLNNYMHLNGSVWVDTSKFDMDLIMGNEDIEDFRGTVYDYPDNFSPEYKYSSEGKKIYRPFTMLAYTHYRPFRTQLLTLIPSIGFSINYLYPEVAAIEGGLSARFDLGNVFITTLGINYNDRKWKNSMDFIFNMRLLELDLGLSLQSPNFVRSWQGEGFGISLGIKMGW